MSPVRNTKPTKLKHKISNGVRVIIKNLQKKIPVNPKRIKQAVLKVISSERAFTVKKSGEITIIFVDDKTIRELNLMYLGRSSATDVISFDNSVNKKQLLADIAISTQTALRNARTFKTTPMQEIYLYVIHGILHILGYNDDNKRNKLRMNKKEKYLLSTIDYRLSTKYGNT